MPTVWIVEDDENIRGLVVYALNAKGFAAAGFENGADFFEALGNRGSAPDLVLLDVMLPEEDGLSLLRRLKAGGRTGSLPVIMLTAKGSEYDRVKGFDLGADDYIPKPFGVLELIARINAVLRRSGQASSRDAPLRYKTIVLDDERRSVFADDRRVELTFKEYELLRCLLINAEIVLSRDKILDTVGLRFRGRKPHRGHAYQNPQAEVGLVRRAHQDHPERRLYDRRVTEREETHLSFHESCYSVVRCLAASSLGCGVAQPV